MGKDIILKKVKLSDIKTGRLRYYNGSKVKRLVNSIKGGGYSPKTHGSRIVLAHWGASVAPTFINTIKDKQFSIVDGHHRVKTLKSLYPPDYEVEVEIRQVSHNIKIGIIIGVLIVLLGVLWLIMSNWWIILLVLFLGIILETRQQSLIKRNQRNKIKKKK